MSMAYLKTVISIANALGLLQSCTKPSLLCLWLHKLALAHIVDLHYNAYIQITSEIIIMYCRCVLLNIFYLSYIHLLA